MANIGDRVEHKLNHFVGIVTGRTEYANGCRQLLVQPEKLDKDGKMQDGSWIDEQYWNVLDTGILPNPFAQPDAPAIAGGADHHERPTR